MTDKQAKPDPRDQPVMVTTADAKPETKTAEAAQPGQTVTVATKFPIDALEGAGVFPTITAGGVQMSEDELVEARKVAKEHGVGLTVSRQETP